VHGAWFMVSIVRNSVSLIRFVPGATAMVVDFGMYNLFLMCLLLVLRERVRRNGEIISQQDCDVRSKVHVFFFHPKKNHDLGLKKRNALKKNLYYGIVSRARKFDVEQYCSREQLIAII